MTRTRTGCPGVLLLPVLLLPAFQLAGPGMVEAQAPTGRLSTSAARALRTGPATTALPRSTVGGREAPAPQEASDTVGVSPGGAFLRSLLVPGWGHAAVHAYGRGAFYFLTAGATGWMLFKTGHFLGAAEDRRSLARRQVRLELTRRGVSDPDSLAILVEEDERWQAAQDLVEVRSQQFEDWTAFGVFWLFMNAADAFVSAHLWDFPEPIDVEARPMGRPGRAGARIRVSVPLGGRP